MQVNRFKKAAVVGLVSLTATAGLIATTMTAATADPTRPYAAVGSDTIQDVWNGLSNDFGSVVPDVASWNAFPNPPATDLTTGNAYVQTKTNGNWFIRPSGSGEGVKALSATWDTADHPSHQYPFSGSTAAVLSHEDVDFARSSGGPATGTGLKYLPFARDAVSIAFKPSGTLTSGLNLTTGQLTEIYSGVDNAADPVVTFSAQPSTASTVVSVNGVVVHPKIPQSGSGTRKFFLGAIGVSNTIGAEAPYITDPGLPAAGGIPENDGSQLTTAGDLVPFSAAQWIAQANGKAPVDTTTGLAIASINGSAAVSGAAPSETPGPLFGGKNGVGDFNTVPSSTALGTFNRDTFDVIPASFLTGTLKQTTLVQILSSLGGASAKTVIRSYGFGSLSYAGNSSFFLDGKWS
ncbi:MAG: hypothetical protein ACJ72E_01725 [Marmoricola sp.]